MPFKLAARHLRIHLPPLTNPVFFKSVWKFRSPIRRWLIVLIWMTVIFSASNDRASFQHSSRILEPLVRWMFPALPEPKVQSAVYVLRKCAHFCEFALLAVLVWRALRLTRSEPDSGWHTKTAVLALIIVVGYAITDEMHQRFVPSRVASPVDVLIDSMGALSGLALVWAFWRLRSRRRSANDSV